MENEVDPVRRAIERVAESDLDHKITLVRPYISLDLKAGRLDAGCEVVLIRPSDVTERHPSRVLVRDEGWRTMPVMVVMDEDLW